MEASLDLETSVHHQMLNHLQPRAELCKVSNAFGLVFHATADVAIVVHSG